MENRDEKRALVRDMVRTMREQRCGRVHSDVLGSYTGMSEGGEGGYDDPVQDADDL